MKSRVVTSLLRRADHRWGGVGALFPGVGGGGAFLTLPGHKAAEFSFLRPWL